jgi:hypothetical protein
MTFDCVGPDPPRLDWKVPRPEVLARQRLDEGESSPRSAGRFSRVKPPKFDTTTDDGLGYYRGTQARPADAGDELVMSRGGGWQPSA